MFEMMFGKKGFTLIELIVVIIIIGILAAIAAPMMQKNVDSAKRTEAIAALGAIRTAERLVKMEIDGYESFAGGGGLDATTHMKKYMSATDLDGNYYKNSNYGVTSAGRTAYAITGNPNLDCSMNLDNGYITLDIINGGVN